MTTDKIDAEKVMPFRCPTSFSIVPQTDFGDNKTILRTRVGREISDVSYFGYEAEVLLPIDYTGEIVRDSWEHGEMVIHSKHVAPSSIVPYRDPSSQLYHDHGNVIVYIHSKRPKIEYKFDPLLPEVVARALGPEYPPVTIHYETEYPPVTIHYDTEYPPVTIHYDNNIKEDEAIVVYPDSKKEHKKTRQWITDKFGV